MICKECGKEFEPTSPQQKFCCKQHCQKYNRRLHKKLLEPRICKTCGKEFMPTTQQQIYCSRKCNSESNRPPLNGHIGDTLKCAKCGTEFVKTTSKQKYCCKKCAKQAYNEQTYLSNKTKAEECKKVVLTRKQIRPSKCVEIEAKMRLVGKEYADWQMQDSINRYGRVQI